MPRIFAAALTTLALAACRSSSVPTFREELLGTCWQLAKLGEKPLVEGVQVTLCFDGDGQVTGSGGCNQYSAPARFEGTGLSIGPIGSTRMAGPPAVMEQEQLYFQRLERARRWVIDGRELLLFGEDPPALRFARLQR